jgi:hypothetical protein
VRLASGPIPVFVDQFRPKQDFREVLVIAMKIADRDDFFDARPDGRPLGGAEERKTEE